ncbi:hypothetical protein Bbelb_349980 [Branchiostoma belcheri]|nr:hypothetical protein Bbelb_349980 [Branchiostoma belcheri]
MPVENVKPAESTLTHKCVQGGNHALDGDSEKSSRFFATQNLFDAVWRDFYGRTSVADDLDQLTTCYCSTCTEFGQVVSVRSRRRHEAIQVKKEAERLKDGRGKDENDCRNGPIIGNGASSNEWTRIGFTAAVLKIRADNPGVSQGCITDIFCLFKRVLDDHGIDNSVPESYREAKSLVNDILPKSRTYHACPNGCVLFVGEYENSTTCPKCKGSRFDSETNKPYKEYEYFSHSGLSQDPFRHPRAEPPKLVSDIQQTEKWREMYSPEGIYKILKIFNFPPELRNKTGLYILLGMIPGPKAPHNMDAFHQLMVEELLSLTKPGIRVWDAYKKEYFTLTALMSWHTSLTGLPDRSARATRVPEPPTTWSEFHVTTYGSSRCFLPENHPLRLDDKHFPDKRVEDQAEPPPHEDLEAYGKAYDVLDETARKVLQQNTGKTGEEMLAFIPMYNIKRIPVDWMHTAKNIAHNAMEVLTGSKHNFQTLVRMEKSLGRFVDDVAQVAVGQSKRARVVVQPYELSKQQMAEARVLTCKVPIGYDWRVRELLQKAHGMKSIEWMKVCNMSRRSVREVLTHLLRLPKHKSCGQEISVRFSGDGRQVTRNNRIGAVMGTVRIVPNRNTINANLDNAQLHHSIDEEASVFIYEGGEDYETQQKTAALVYQEIEDIRQNGIVIDGKLIKVKWYLTADWKYMATLLGLNQASSKAFCIWCHCTKKDICDFDIDSWNIQRKPGDDNKYAGKRDHKGHILPTLLHFPFEEIVPDVLHMVVVWAINQRRTEQLLSAMKDIGVPFRLMEGAGDDGQGSIKTWTQLNAKQLERVFAKLDLKAVLMDRWTPRGLTIASLSVAQLKIELRKHGLEETGRKPSLKGTTNHNIASAEGYSNEAKWDSVGLGGGEVSSGGSRNSLKKADSILPSHSLLR